MLDKEFYHVSMSHGKGTVKGRLLPEICKSGVIQCHVLLHCPSYISYSYGMSRMLILCCIRFIDPKEFQDWGFCYESELSRIAAAVVAFHQ